MKCKNQVVQVFFSTSVKYCCLSIGIAGTVAGSVLASLVPPLVLGRIIDRLTAGQSGSVFLMISYFAFFAITGILDSLREIFLIVFGQKITHTLRSRLSDKLSCLTTDSLNQQEPGALTARFVGDVNTVEMLFTSGIISMVTDICKIISILIVIWKKARGLAGILLVCLPVLFIFTRVVQKRMLKAQLENRAAVSKVTNHVPESLRCIRMIHTLRKESYMEQRYDEYIGQSYQAIEKNNFCDSVYSPVVLIFNAMITALVMLLSASGNPRILTIFGMSVGTSVAMIHYISQVFSPLESLGMEIQTIQSAMAGICRINEFLNQPEREKRKEKKKQDSKSFCVEFRQVTFGYDSKIPVLKQVNFCLEPGEQAVICGRSGIGKSTIFKLILGLYQPQSGEVLIDQIPASSIPDEKKRKLFGYVDQSFHMVQGSVKDQITLFDPSITEEMIVTAAKLTRMHETICSLEQGYETECTPSLFSQGQWQLLSITRAVVAQPKILLLDEITANLDAKTEQTVLEALRRVSLDRTVLSISHRTHQNFAGKRITIE